MNLSQTRRDAMSPSDSATIPHDNAASALSSGRSSVGLSSATCEPSFNVNAPSTDLLRRRSSRAGVLSIRCAYESA